MPLDEMSTNRQPPRHGRPVLLSKSGRLAAGAVGTATASAGAVAVYVTDNEVGTTALLLIGGVALLMALTGRVPDRITREGIDYSPVEAAVEGLLTDRSTPNNVREAVADAVQSELVDGSQSAPSEPVATLAAGVLYEAQVFDALAHTPLPEGSTLSPRVHVDGTEFDAVIHHPQLAPLQDPAHTVVIEAAWRLTRHRLQRDLDRLSTVGGKCLIHIASQYRMLRSSEIRSIIQTQAHIRYYGLILLSEGHNSTTKSAVAELGHMLDRAWSTAHNSSQPQAIELKRA